MWEIRRYFSLSLPNLLISLSLDKVFSSIYSLRSENLWTFYIREEPQTSPQMVIYGTVPCSGIKFSLFTKSVYILLSCPALVFPSTYSTTIASDIPQSFTKTNQRKITPNNQKTKQQPFIWPTHLLFPTLDD